MASAEARIEIVVKNLNSLNRIEKALSKITSQNDKVISSLDKVVNSLSKVESKIVGIGKASATAGQQQQKLLTGTTKTLSQQFSKWSGIRAAIKSIKIAVGTAVLGVMQLNKEVAKTFNFSMQLPRNFKNLYVDFFASSKKPLQELNKIIGDLKIQIGQYHSSQMMAVTGDVKAIEVKNQLAGALREQGKEQARVNNLIQNAQGPIQLGPGGKGRGIGRRFVNTPEIEQAKMRDREIRRRTAIAREKSLTTVVTADTVPFYPTGTAGNTGSQSKRVGQEIRRLKTIDTNVKRTAAETKRAASLLAAQAFAGPAALPPGIGTQYGAPIGPVAPTRFQRAGAFANKVGFGQNANPKGVFANSRGMQGRVGGAVSSGLIGGGFPLLFGQSPLAALFGGVGGAVGGALGGGFGFGLSIAGTAIASRIQEARDFEKAVSKLNTSIKATGGTSVFTAGQVREFAKSLGLSKDEALQALTAFKQFEASARVALTSVFGSESVFDTLSGFGTGSSSNFLNALPELSKELSLEQTKIALQTLKINGLKEAELKILDQVISKNKEVMRLEGTRINLFDKLNPFRGGVKRREDGQIRALTVEELREQRLEKDFEKVLIEAKERLKIQKEFNQLLERELLLSQARDELIQLTDPINQLVSGATAIGNAFSESFKGIISGSMSAQEALANLFKRTADHFVDMAAEILAAQIRAKIVGIFASSFGSAATSGFSVTDAVDSKFMSPANAATIGSGGFVETVIGGSADGRYASRPMVSSLVERGEPEYVIPASKMSSAMQRYSAGARGESVIPGTGSSQSVGGGGGSTTVNYSGPILTFNSEEFVPKSAVGEIIATATARGAKAGETRTLSSLKNSRSRRSTIGL